MKMQCVKVWTTVFWDKCHAIL